MRPAKAGAFSGKQTRRGKSQSPVVWMAGRRETDALKVRPAKAGAFSGGQARRGKSQNPVAWMAERKETDSLKPIDTSP